MKSKFEVYSFNATKAHEILDELYATGLIKVSLDSFPTSEQTRGRTYYKFHNAWTHNIASCVKLKDQIQEWINEGRIQFKAAANINVAMIDFSQEKKNIRRPTLELLTSKAKEGKNLFQRRLGLC